MKKITLIKGEHDKHFEMLYIGFIVGGTLTQQKGLPALRRELIILDKLEAVSQLCADGKKAMGEEPARELVGGVIELSGQEYEMVNSYLGNVPWSTGRAVRDALATIDWLASL